MDFTLRKWKAEDAESIALYANNLNIARWLRDVFPYPYCKQDAVDFIYQCMQSQEENEVLRAIEVDGQAVGSIGLFQKTDVYCKSMELGYWLAEPFWGRAIMSRAIEQITSFAFAHYDIVRIFAEPFADNLGSRRALEKAGFTLEAILKSSVFKLGVLQDSCIYALVR